MISELRIQNLREELWKYHELIEKFDEKFREDCNFPERKKELTELEKQTLSADFWHDPQEATKIMKKISDLKKEVEEIEMIQLLIDDGQLNAAKKLIGVYEFEKLLDTIEVRHHYIEKE
jgi:hypothetical protein